MIAECLGMSNCYWLLVVIWQWINIDWQTDYCQYITLIMLLHYIQNISFERTVHCTLVRYHDSNTAKWHDNVTSWQHNVMTAWRYDSKMSWCHDSSMTACLGCMITAWQHDNIMMSWQHENITTWYHNVMTAVQYDNNDNMTLWQHENMTSW